jgi:hypothetical protein
MASFSYRFAVKTGRESIPTFFGKIPVGMRQIFLPFATQTGSGSIPNCFC